MTSRIKMQAQQYGIIIRWVMHVYGMGVDSRRNLTWVGICEYRSENFIWYKYHYEKMGNLLHR